MQVAAHLAALLFVLTAIFGFVNSRWLRLPHTIAMVVIALGVSLTVIAIDWSLPEWGLRDGVREMLDAIDFPETLMKGLLGFLLFAGALHVDLDDLVARRWAITVLATVGVLISTGLVATALWYAFDVLGLDLPFAYALVLGAILAPTDPVAVLGILKKVRVPKSLEADIAGESLFNDGVGVVLFSILVALAAGGEDIGAGEVAGLFVLEALGGAVLGLGAGYLAFLAMRRIDDHVVEVLITLALVTGAYTAADMLEVSGLIATVVAGILIGNPGRRLAMSTNTREHLVTFWALIDEILNSVLFLLIGFELVAIALEPSHLLAAALAVPTVLAARLVSVAVPMALPPVRGTARRGELWILTWGGLKGGISVALALALPDSPARELILAVCYGVVVFSIVVQGLTMERVVRHFYPPAPSAPAAPPGSGREAGP